MNLILSFKEYNAIKNLTESELDAYNFILYGVNESNINEGILDRLKTMARKGVLTATVISSLMGNPSFAKEYKSLPDTDKDKIEQMVSTGKTENDEDTLLIKAGENFESGRYKLDDAGKKKMNAEFGKIVEFLKNNAGKSSFTVRIVASESTPKNIDAETGKPLPRKELSRLRAKEMENAWKEYISPIMQNAQKSGSNLPDIKIEVSEPRVGTEKTDFKLDQYVNIEVKANPDAVTLCSKIQNETAKAADASTNYISIGRVIPATNTYGKGSVVLKPGTVPDRLVIRVDGKVIGDTGFFINRSTDSSLSSEEKSKCAKKENDYKEWRYVPSYVAQLTTISIKNPEATQDTPMRKLQRRKFASFQDLVKYMLNSKYQEYDWTKDHRGEIGAPEKIIGTVNSTATPFKQLEKIGTVNGKWNPDQEFIFYDLNSSNNSINYLLIGDNKTVDYRVYSPLIQTGVGIEALCGI